jgi:hypothetical protein
VRDDRDLRAPARLPGDAGDLNELVRDLGDLQLEELLDQLGIAARDDDARALGVGGDIGDHGLDPHAVVVALVVDLLGTGQQCLDTLAELDQRVAVVGLLDDPGDQLADAVLVLLEHHAPLGLADPLQDHLLGRLGGDAPEVVGGDVARLDLVHEGLETLGLELLLGGLAALARLGVDAGAGGLDLGHRLAGRLRGLGGLQLLLELLVEQALLEILRDHQLVDAEVRAAVVELDLRVLRGSRGLLVRGQQRILKRVHQGVGGDPLLLLEHLDGVDDFLGHATSSGTRFERRTLCNGMVTAPSGASRLTRSSSAAVSVPVKL